jgi:hypothetical protein
MQPQDAGVVVRKYDDRGDSDMHDLHSYSLRGPRIETGDGLIHETGVIKNVSGRSYLRRLCVAGDFWISISPIDGSIRAGLVRPGAVTTCLACIAERNK